MTSPVKLEGKPAPGGGKAARKPKADPRPAHSAAAVPSNAADLAALESRQAEIRWLTQHYAVRIRALLADNEALRQRIKTMTAAETAQAAPVPVTDAREAQELGAELAHAMAANERYLARIYELKAQIASAEGT